MNLRTIWINLFIISFAAHYPCTAALPSDAPAKTTKRIKKSKPCRLHASQRTEAHIQYIPNITKTETGKKRKKRVFLSHYKSEKTLKDSIITTLSSWADKLKSWNTKKLAQRGLTNWSGNHCYMNATFQALAHCPVFMSIPCPSQLFSSSSRFFEFLLAMKFHQQNSSLFDTSKLASFQQELQINLTNNCFGLNELYRQQDAHEFIVKLFDNIIDAGHKATLTGTSTSTLTCKSCHKTRNTDLEQQSILPLNLPIQSDAVTLKSCIEKHNTQENVTVACPHCGNTNQPHDKQITYLSLPKTLVIQLKRFQNQENVIQKNETPVMIQGTVALPNPDHGAQNVEYSLKSIILHSGLLLGGHYIALVRDEKGWLIYNDSKVLDGAAAIQDLILTGKYGPLLPYLCFYERN